MNVHKWVLIQKAVMYKLLETGRTRVVLYILYKIVLWFSNNCPWNFWNALIERWSVWPSAWIGDILWLLWPTKYSRCDTMWLPKPPDSLKMLPFHKPALTLSLRNTATKMWEALGNEAAICWLSGSNSQLSSLYSHCSPGSRHASDQDIFGSRSSSLVLLLHSHLSLSSCGFLSEFMVHKNCELN